MNSRLRVTHTLAMLELSPAAYKEIESKLRAAGYSHAFNKENSEGEFIDMSGIGVVCETEEMETT